MKNTTKTDETAIDRNLAVNNRVLVNYCKECNKPLYVPKNIEIFGFDPDKFCRNNFHLETISKPCC